MPSVSDNLETTLPDEQSAAWASRVALQTARLLSVIMPVYNERRTLRTIIRRVLESPTPIPLALIGVGVASLLAANFGIAGGSADRDAASGTGAARAVSKATLSKGAGECAEYGRPRTERVRGAGRSLRASVERNPLLVGLTGLICGAALGALLPSSRREQDWVDATRGELWEKAEQISHEAADRVRGLAEPKAGATDR